MPHPDQLFNALRDFIADVDARKKQATDGVGETTHPVGDADGGTQDPSTGARAAENEKDVKDDVPGLSVNEATDPSPTETEQDALQPNIGPQQSATGEDPSVEDDYKADKDDPGTTHPAKADDGEKYASASFEELVARFGKVADALLADVAVGDAAARRPAGTSAKSAAAAGYAAAASAGAPDDREARARRTIEDTIKEANHAADLVARFLPELYESMRKQAEGDDDGGDDGDKGGDPAPGQAPPDDGSGGGDPSGGDMAGGGAAGDPMGGQGGEEMLSQMLGQPQAPPSHDEVMGGVNGAMDDLQISPEILQQIVELLQQAGADGGGEAPIKQARLLQKVASEARKYRRSGRYEIGPAKTARAREIRASMRSYLSEVLNSVTPA